MKRQRQIEAVVNLVIVSDADIRSGVNQLISFGEITDDATQFRTRGFDLSGCKNLHLATLASMIIAKYRIEGASIAFSAVFLPETLGRCAVDRL